MVVPDVGTEDLALNDHSGSFLPRLKIPKFSGRSPWSWLSTSMLRVQISLKSLLSTFNKGQAAKN